MIKLIDKTDIASFKPLSLNINEAKGLEPFIIESQEFDLKPVLEDELYLALLDDFENNSLGIYGDLFNGVEYTYDNRKYVHRGIKASLIYQTYARYLSNANSHSTAFGIMQKKNDYSEQVSEPTIKRLIQQAKAGSIEYQNQWIDYLCRKPDLYPLWKKKQKPVSEINKLSLRIRAISNRK